LEEEAPVRDSPLEMVDLTTLVGEDWPEITYSTSIKAK
jgi:hypothetical protein